jgi:hypothetical protein
MLAKPADFSASKGHGHHQHVVFPFSKEAATALAPLQIPVPHAREDQEAEGKSIERHASAFDNPVRGCRKCPKHQAEMFDFLAGGLLIPDAISAEADLGESRRFEADEICHLHRKPRGCVNDTGEQVWILESLGQTPFFVLISQPARSR